MIWDKERYLGLHRVDWRALEVPQSWGHRISLFFWCPQSKQRGAAACRRTPSHSQAGKGTQHHHGYISPETLFLDWKIVLLLFRDGSIFPVVGGNVINEESNFRITVTYFFPQRLGKKPKIPLLVLPCRKRYSCGCFHPNMFNFIIFYKDHHGSQILNQSIQIYKSLQGLFDCLPLSNLSIPFREMNSSVISDLLAVSGRRGECLRQATCWPAKLENQLFRSFLLTPPRPFILDYPPTTLPRLGEGRGKKTWRFGTDYYWAYL